MGYIFGMVRPLKIPLTITNPSFPFGIFSADKPIGLGEPIA